MSGARAGPAPLAEELPRGVLLLHPSRVGSTVLGDLMGQRPDVRWKGELFGRLLWRARARGEGALARGEDPAERLLRGLRPGVPPVVGAELTHWNVADLQLDLHAFLDRVQAGGFCDLVLLRRRNVVRRLVSYVAGSRSQRWSTRAGEPLSGQRVRLDPAGVELRRRTLPLVEMLESFERDEELLAEAVAGRGALTLVYEHDVEADPLVAYRKLCDHLGLPPYDVEVRYRRTGCGLVRELLENPHEVEAALTGTRFAWMLDA